jgi:hypothetical protein
LYDLGYNKPPIVDYTFWGLNDETIKLVPREAMQFGHVLECLLYEIAHHASNEHGPVYLLKVDLSDGFYCISVHNDDLTKLGVVFPTAVGEEPMVAFPLVLPMGWTENPLIFCAATETVVDLANQYMEHWDPPWSSAGGRRLHTT